MRKCIAIVAAAGLSISGVVASAGPAQADVPCHITGFTPSTVVVGLSTVTRTMRVTSSCTMQGWALRLDTPVFTFVGWDWSNDTDWETFSDEGPWPHPLTNADAGGHTAYAFADIQGGGTLERSWPSGFHLKRQSSWLAGSRFNAGPELVKKGRAITIQGTLSRANWDTFKYQVHGFQPVQVQFKTPTGRYAAVKTVSSTANGSVKTTVSAQRTGFWRLVYRGNSTSGPINTVGDRVKVS